jgi:hypothetical protein
MRFLFLECYVTSFIDEVSIYNARYIHIHSHDIHGESVHGFHFTNAYTKGPVFAQEVVG